MTGQEEIFRKELAGVLRLGKSQGNRLSSAQVRETFSASDIDETKFSYIYEYLANHNITVDDAFDPDEAVSGEDRDYLAMYMKELEALPKLSEQEKKAVILKAMEDDAAAGQQLLEAFLPKVTEIARLYAGQGVLMEDLIGEGNVALAAAVSMAGCIEKPEDADGFFAGMIMDAMEVLVSTEADEKEIGNQILEQVNRVTLAAEELYRDLRRKVTPQELADATDLTEAEIKEAYRLSGRKIEALEIAEDEA